VVENANKLLKLLNRYRFKINIIPYNEILDLSFTRPSEREIDRFVNVLRKSYDAPVMIRDSKGLDIDGACGQLIR
jgi:23S rRNA (adenine2503-C2)-methyltransferase